MTNCFHHGQICFFRWENCILRTTAYINKKAVVSGYITLVIWLSEDGKFGRVFMDLDLILGRPWVSMAAPRSTIQNKRGSLALENSML